MTFLSPSPQSFEKFLSKAWVEHSNNPREVCARVEKTAMEVKDAQCVIDAARLITHLYGVHFGEWADGIAALRRLRAHPACVDGSALAAALARKTVALELAWDPTTDISYLPVAVQIHAFATAAPCVLERGDCERAVGFLHDAERRAEKMSSEDETGALRALAIAGNNFATSMEELPLLNSAQLDAMLYAARLGRTYWERAGTWLEIERAEYRLSKCFLKAGKNAAARGHAQACLRICELNNAGPLEFFFGIEALLRAMRASAAEREHMAHLKARALALFEQLEREDQAWCEPTLQQLARV
jgi:hypothetical protein